MNQGFICDWNYNDEVGRITACNGVLGCYSFDWGQCSAGLQAILSQHRLIHVNGPCPGPAYAIQVKFDLDLTGAAINVDV